MRNKFFGSKLNSILLLSLIILVIIAICIMWRNKGTYFGLFEKNTQSNNQIVKDPIILGKSEDLIAFSIAPDTKVKGVVPYRGIIKGGYFFEGNILINILSKDRQVLKASNATAKGDWMTKDNVEFEGNIDFTNLPKGGAYFEIHNDNPSGLLQNDKSILIPIVIE